MGTEHAEKRQPNTLKKILRGLGEIALGTCLMFGQCNPAFAQTLKSNVRSRPMGISSNVQYGHSIKTDAISGLVALKSFDIGGNSGQAYKTASIQLNAFLHLVNVNGSDSICALQDASFFVQGKNESNKGFYNEYSIDIPISSRQYEIKQLIGGNSSKEILPMAPQDNRYNYYAGTSGKLYFLGNAHFQERMTITEKAIVGKGVELTFDFNPTWHKSEKYVIMIEDPSIESSYIKAEHGDDVEFVICGSQDGEDVHFKSISGSMSLFYKNANRFVTFNDIRSYGKVTKETTDDIRTTYKKGIMYIHKGDFDTKQEYYDPNTYTISDIIARQFINPVASK